MYRFRDSIRIRNLFILATCKHAFFKLSCEQIKVNKNETIKLLLDFETAFKQ